MVSHQELVHGSRVTHVFVMETRPNFLSLKKMKLGTIWTEQQGMLFRLNFSVFEDKHIANRRENQGLYITDANNYW